MNTRIPDVAMIASDGSAVRTGDIGRALIFFFPKADTPGCTNEAKDFSALSEAFATRGVRLIGVSKDSPAKLAKFAAKHDLAVELWSDEASDLAERLGVWGERQMYGRTYMGLERASFLFGADGMLEREWRKVKVAGHAQAVLDAS